MLKTHLAACLIATALAAPALAQTATAPASNQGSAARSGQFMNTLQPNHWRASKLIGVDIYGFDGDNRSDREKIGDVNEIVVDRNGHIQAVVIGVGGFLGLGEKDVAIPFQQVEWRYEEGARTAANDANRSGYGNTAATNPSVARNTSAPDTTAPPSTTAGTATQNNPNPPASNNTVATAPRSGDATTTGTVARQGTADTRQGYPDRGYIRMSKADLQNAPAFSYDASEARQGAASGNTNPPPARTNPPGNAPRQ